MRRSQKVGPISSVTTPALCFLFAFPFSLLLPTVHSFHPGSAEKHMWRYTTKRNKNRPPESSVSFQFHGRGRKRIPAWRGFCESASVAFSSGISHNFAGSSLDENSFTTVRTQLLRAFEHALLAKGGKTLDRVFHDLFFRRNRKARSIVNFPYRGKRARSASSEFFISIGMAVRGLANSLRVRTD